MKRLFFLFFAAFFYACVTVNTSSKNSLTASKQERQPEKLYEEFCSSCHGNKVAAFVDRKWKHGNTKNEILASITNGYLEQGMPAWQNTFTAGEANALADYIVESLGTVTQYDFVETRQEVYDHLGLKVKPIVVADSLEIPWGMVVLPEGELLVSDRNGKLYLIKDKVKEAINGVPKTLSQGQGGLLDLALHPKYKENGYIYLSYSKSKEEKDKVLSTTAIVRFKLDGTQVIELQEVFEALPYSTTRHHYGSRMVFDSDGFLFFSVGDRGNRDVNPQSLENHCGKIHRIMEDGRIPRDNPFYANPNAMKSIWSYGHRNPQGLSIEPTTGLIWETEHGPRGGDEVNIIQKGQNFGWPIISYGINYDGTTFTTLTQKEGMNQPVIYWLPSIAPSGLTFVSSEKYPQWKGHLLAGSLRFNYVNLCKVNAQKITEEVKILPNIGRTRNIIQGADGYLYVSVENPGTIYKLMPL